MVYNCVRINCKRKINCFTAVPTKKKTVRAQCQALLHDPEVGRFVNADDPGTIFAKPQDCITRTCMRTVIIIR